jgi:hypothetical protein
VTFIKRESIFVCLVVSKQYMIYRDSWEFLIQQ